MNTTERARRPLFEHAAALTPAAAKAIYRAAIDTRAHDHEGVAWWDEVVAEVQAVAAAPDTRHAAALIAWWHADWRAIGDTPVQAAQRLRRAARALAGDAEHGGRSPTAGAQS